MRACQPSSSSRTSGSASPIGVRTTRSACSSYGVGSALTIARCRDISASPAAGMTVKLVPMATSRSAVRAAVMAPSSTSGSKRWPNETVAVLRMPAALAAPGVGFVALHRLQGRRPVAALEALDLPDAAVELDHVRGPRTLVQAVDVLGEDRPETTCSLKVCQRQVAGVRLRGPGGVMAAALPRPNPYLGVLDVRLNVEHRRGVRVLGPHPVGSAEIGNPGIRAHAGAGEHDDPPARGPEFSEGIGHGVSIPAVGTARRGSCRVAPPAHEARGHEYGGHARAADRQSRGTLGVRGDAQCEELRERRDEQDQ